MSTFKTIPITGTCPVTNSDVTVNARYRYIHPLGYPNGHYLLGTVDCEYANICTHQQCQIAEPFFDAD